MLIGVIADDFTGASDIGSALSKGKEQGKGLKCALYLGIPNRKADEDIEAGVIALKSRSISAEKAVLQSINACKWLLEQGCEQIVFKYCSTFDSTTEGNIGPVIDALKTFLGANIVAICPAFPAMGRTVYKGHLFVNDLLLNESGMEKHPLTPMTDSSLVRLTAAQSRNKVELITYQTIQQGYECIRLSLDKLESCIVIMDATNNEDLVEIGKACQDHRLLTGGAGIAIGLPDNFISQKKSEGASPPLLHLSGPEVILVGSCSSASRLQIQEYSKNNPILEVDVEDILSQKITEIEVMMFIESNLNHSPLICTKNEPDYVNRMQIKHGKKVVAEAIESFMSKIAKAVIDRGIRKIIVGGGETSGAIATAINPGEMIIGQEVNAGVPILISRQEPMLAFVLKSGNYGSIDFFSKASKLLNNKE